MRATCAEITDRLPDTIVAKSQRELRDGNHGKAHDIVPGLAASGGRGCSPTVAGGGRVDGDACRGRAPPRWHGCRLRLCYRSGGNLAGGCGSRRTRELNYANSVVSDSTGALPSFVAALAVMDNVDADQRLNARAVDQRPSNLNVRLGFYKGVHRSERLCCRSNMPWASSATSLAPRRPLHFVFSVNGVDVASQGPGRPPTQASSGCAVHEDPVICDRLPRTTPPKHTGRPASAGAGAREPSPGRPRRCQSSKTSP